MRKTCLAIITSLTLTACQQAPQQAVSESESFVELVAEAKSDFAAHWLTDDVIVVSPQESAQSFTLLSSVNAELDNGNSADFSIELKPVEMPAHVQTKFPHLNGFQAFTPVSQIKDIKVLLTHQLALLQKSKSGEPLQLSYLQTAGVLDHLYTSDANDANEAHDLGATVLADKSRFALWAPTAQKVAVKLYDQQKGPLKTLQMQQDSHGIWRTSSNYGQGIWYRYELTLYHPRTQKIETLEVTDPYSLSLSRNSEFSQVVDLSSADTQPDGWLQQKDWPLTHPESLILYETHIRDFSASDNTLSDADFSGKYKAFSETNSDGAKHLQSLQKAGLNTIHLLPTYDLASINEDPTQVIFPDDTLSKVCGIATELELCSDNYDKEQTLQQLLLSFDKNTGDAQALIEQIRPYDPYNWGYDPYHYTVPEGSYALNPEGMPRIVEFREMVQSLHNKGFKVIMDVVYNHTFASGLHEKSVLDKIVPNYYHRLNPVSGAVETSTCCENSATEHAMMAKLMTDSLVVWAKDYKIDGFRFDLMGHQPKADMLQAREAVRAVDPDTYFYGEGWNFGEVANNARFEQAAQLPLAGTEIGTFTDRLRDAVRGGSSFVSGDDIRFGQGIGNGLLVQPNELQTIEAAAAQEAEYYVSMDQIRVGLAGNLVDFPIQDSHGNQVTGKDVPYGDAPTGYALDPADTINYVSKHDNQTLWDNNNYRFAFEASTAQRVRMHNMSLAYPLLAQGIPFLHMGSELLRSKSFLRDSYDYNDWFNAVDFSKQSNNYSVGLPPAVKDEANWPVIKRLLKGNDGRDKVTPEDIEFASAVFTDFIAIRSSSRLFSLQTAEQIIQRVKFHNTGRNQQKGLIVMSITDGQGADDLDPAFDDLLVIFNNDVQNKTVPFDGARQYVLHPVQASGADNVVKATKITEAGFEVPALSVAVLVR